MIPERFPAMVHRSSLSPYAWVFDLPLWSIGIDQPVFADCIFCQQASPRSTQAIEGHSCWVLSCFHVCIPNRPSAIQTLALGAASATWRLPNSIEGSTFVPKLLFLEFANNKKWKLLMLLKEQSLPLNVLLTCYAFAGAALS